MPRMTKAQREALAQQQAPWAFPKGAEIEAAKQSQADAAAQAFFASRMLAAQAEAEQAEIESIDAESADPDDPAAIEQSHADHIIDQGSIDPKQDDPISDDEIAAQQKQAEQAFDAAIEAGMQAADAAASKGKKPYIRQSSIVKPTRAAWAIYDAMHAHAAEQQLPAPTRGECIAEAIARGIASGTSATQYQYWKKASGR